MMELFAALENSSLSAWLRESGSIWAYPTILTLHTLGLALLVGGNIALDLRVLGVAPHVEVSALDRLFPVMWWGFGINAVSGLLLFAADATSKGTLKIFMLKLACVAGGVVVMVAHAARARRTCRRSRGRQRHPAARRVLARALGHGHHGRTLHGVRVMAFLGIDPTPALDAVVTTLKATSLSAWISTSQWVWPICETLHFVGLSMVIGIVGLLDVRLMGFLRRIPIPALRAMVPWGIAGFVINVITGAVFFVGAPEQCVFNAARW